MEGRSLPGMIVEMNDKTSRVSVSHPKFEVRYLPNKSPERNICAMAEPSDYINTIFSITPQTFLKAAIQITTVIR
jgi:hypothetical protein